MLPLWKSCESPVDGLELTLIRVMAASTEAELGLDLATFLWIALRHAGGRGSAVNPRRTRISRSAARKIRARLLGRSVYS